MPEDKQYVNSQKNNRQIMKNIWNQFGKEILNYYHSKGTTISFVPYTASHVLFNRLTRQYFICFVIDGTVSMATEIIKTRVSVGQFIAKYQELVRIDIFTLINSDFALDFSIRLQFVFRTLYHILYISPC